MSITSLGAVYSESLLGGEVSIEGSSSLLLSTLLELKSDATLSAHSDLVLGSSALLKSDVNLTGTTDFVLSPEGEVTQIFPWLRQPNKEDYTIFPQLGTHKELANLNLITQFKDCPKILDFLDISFQELDKASQDIYDFQTVLSLDASGALLDVLGIIVGIKRLTGEDDVLFRDRIKTQILTNTADTSLRGTLIALLAQYRMAPDERSQHELDLRTGFFNEAILYVRDYETVTKRGGYKFVDKLTAGGARTNIVVNLPSTPPAGYFGLAGSNGIGLGSLEDEDLGGEMVGNYNRDINSEVIPKFGLLDAPNNSGLNIGAFVSSLVMQNSSTPEVLLDGPETPTTTSTLGVDTFN